MKVVGESTNPVFPMQVKCERVTDEYGLGYGPAINFCGRMLEIEQSDVKKHKWFKYPNMTGADYGVICPCCKQFVVIPPEKLPQYVKDKAEEILLSK